MVLTGPVPQAITATSRPLPVPILSLATCSSSRRRHQRNEIDLFFPPMMRNALIGPVPILKWPVQKWRIFVNFTTSWRMINQPTVQVFIARPRREIHAFLKESSPGFAAPQPLFKCGRHERLEPSSRRRHQRNEIDLFFPPMMRNARIGPVPILKWPVQKWRIGQCYDVMVGDKPANDPSVHCPAEKRDPCILKRWAASWFRFDAIAL
jgi:hypothetical protein